jgi:hypothetical protein
MSFPDLPRKIEVYPYTHCIGTWLGVLKPSFEVQKEGLGFLYGFLIQIMDDEWPTLWKLAGLVDNNMLRSLSCTVRL